MTPLLALDQVTHRFGGLTAVDDLTWEIPTGARHAVIGPNGAGKSTLLHLVAGSLNPTQGRVQFDGHDITRLGPAAHARLGIGRTWQHPAVFTHLTVADHLALARHHTSNNGGVRVGELLEHAGLHPRATTAAGHLPYGQQRLLEVVTALAAAPRLLLLDEPSAGLDEDERTHLADLITGLPPEVTVVIVDHDLDLVWRLADTVTVLDAGHHLTSGTPAQVRDDPGVKRIYLGDDHADTRRVPVARSAEPAGPALLRVCELRAGYHGAPVLTGVNLDLAAGQVLAILGRQGAGKTTMINAIAGLRRPWPPTTITLDGRQLPPGDAHRAATAGLAVVPQGRRLFAPLTVFEHLRLAEHHARRQASSSGSRQRRWSHAEILALFPALAARLRHRADQLSGGEQQMLAIARALLGNPRVLLLDEPVEGLAPTIRTQIAAVLRRVADEGLAIAVAEPNRQVTGHIADQIVVLTAGGAALCAPADTVTQADLDALLGTNAAPDRDQKGHGGLPSQVRR